LEEILDQTSACCWGPDSIATLAKQRYAFHTPKQPLRKPFDKILMQKQVFKAFDQTSQQQLTSLRQVVSVR